MAAPATTGQLRTDIASMEIGDYIAVTYNAIIGSIIQLKSVGINNPNPEAPYNGISVPSERWTTDYMAYFVKVEEGLLLADRVLIHSVSWDQLNANKLIQGKNQTFIRGLDGVGDISGKLRSLTGGVAYADANGNQTNNWPTPAVGYWPTNNEWDRFVSNFPKELILPNYTLEDVFHWSGIYTWTQDTYRTSSANRTIRGYSFESKGGGQFPSSTISGDKAFRPVFQYHE